MPETQYFVSFGRERGGLLSVLGLRPGVPLVEIRGKCVQYRASLNTAYREALQTLKKRRDRGEITPEEFEAEDTKAKQERTDKTAQFNSVVAAWEKQQGQLREMASSGVTRNQNGWRQMYRAVSVDELNHELSRPSPLPRFDPEWVLQVKRRWLGPPHAATAASFPLLASCRTSVSEADSLGVAVEVAAEKRLAYMLAADDQWLKLKYTNRAYWQKQIDEWVHLEESLGPRFEPGSAGSAAPIQPEYPALCQRASGAIDRLEVQDASEDPDSSKPQTAFSARAILEILTRNSRAVRGARSDDPNTDTERDALLRMLLEQLQGESQTPDASL
jgi:hypothetical protein